MLLLTNKQAGVDAACASPACVADKQNDVVCMAACSGVYSCACIKHLLFSSASNFCFSSAGRDKSSLQLIEQVIQQLLRHAMVLDWGHSVDADVQDGRHLELKPKFQ